MLSVRAYLCAANANQYSRLLAVSKSFPRTFNTLSRCNTKLLHSYNPIKNLAIFNKQQVKYEFFNRKVGTITIEKTTNAVRNKVGLWLLCCSGMVFVAITLGGYTRLSESGLSMVNWNFSFESYPTTEDRWLEEFKKYQAYPEFKMLKKDITLNEFKKIWITEYLHRNWGRILGVVFLVPATLFWVKGFFKPLMKKRILIIGTLIASQGLLGWHMVKSGLEDRFHEDTDVPRVSQYRLAAHLSMALTLFMSFTWTALDLLSQPVKVSNIIDTRKLKIMAHSCKGLVFLTAVSGAFVAGLDAGLIYNSFPKMGDKWIPDDILALSPLLKNFTENPTTVQFSHRILGLTTFSTIMATWLFSKKYALPKQTARIANFLALAAICQVGLGISTLVHYVPIYLAVIHQSGSVVLISLATYLSHQLKMIKYVPK